MKTAAVAWSESFLLIFAGCLIVGGGCGSRPPPPDPPRAPQWIPLNAPQSEVDLPAFMVGEQGELSSGCFLPTASSNVASADTMQWSSEQQKRFDSNLQLTFSQHLVDAGLDAGLANAFTQKWSLQIEKLSFAKVDAAAIRPNFSNAACTASALKWFTDKRFVVTAAAKAGKVSIRASTAMSGEQKAKVDIAISKINTKFHAGFQNLSAAGDALAIDASNVYIGALGTTLVVEECAEAALVMAFDQQVNVCNGKYALKISPSAIAERFTLSVTPSDGSTAKFDEKFGEQQVRKLDDLRILRAMVNKEGAGLRAKLSILLVGAAGAR